MKLLYAIEIANDSDPLHPDRQPGNYPMVRFRYLGGATGPASIRIYKVGDPPPAWTLLDTVVGNPGSTFRIGGQDDDVDPGDYNVEYKDNSTALKNLGIATINPWVGSCYESLGGGPVYYNGYTEITRFESKVVISVQSFPEVQAVSIDNEVTYKTLVYNGFDTSAEYTNAELALLSFVDTIPTIKIRRTYLEDQQTVISFADPLDVDWPAAGFTRVNVPSSAPYGLGTNVNFSPTTNYGSGTVVETGSGYIIIQHSFNGNPSGVKVGYTTLCITDQAADFFIGELSISDFVLTESHTNVTTEGGSDGTITLNIVGGSGSFTYEWDDGPTLSNRSSLPAGEYHVVVTDTVTEQEEELIIIITEPSTSPVEGTFLEVPFMNSLTFVDRSIPIDDIENPQALDNRLFCEQEFQGFEKTNYFNRVCKADKRILQFNSDFSNFIIEVKNHFTGVVVKTYAFNLKEQNIGVPQDFPITIKEHTVSGQSRIYFETGPIPIPLEIGNTFSIYNNVDGYNGNYAIVTIEFDLTLGYQYLVINKLYNLISDSSIAVGRFFVNSTDFNVFEASMLFDDLEGDYFITIDAIKLNGTRANIPWQSEPISVAEVWKGTCLVEYRNKDNAFGITWTTGYIGQLRVEAHLFKRLPGGERATNRNADYSLTKTSAKKIRGVLFEVYFLPPYLHEKLSTAFDCDFYFINKVGFQSTDAYAEPQYIEAFMLANSSIKVEQAKWFTFYNSDDLGTVNEIPPGTIPGIYDFTYDPSYE